MVTRMSKSKPKVKNGATAVPIKEKKPEEKPKKVVENAQENAEKKVKKPKKAKKVEEKVENAEEKVKKPKKVRQLREDVQLGIQKALELARSEISQKKKLKRFFTAARKAGWAVPMPVLEGTGDFFPDTKKVLNKDTNKKEDKPTHYSEAKKQLAGQVVLLFQLTKAAPRAVSFMEQAMKEVDWTKIAGKNTEDKLKKGRVKALAIYKSMNVTQEMKDEQKEKNKKKRKEYKQMIKKLVPSKKKKKASPSAASKASPSPIRTLRKRTTA